MTKDEFTAAFALGFMCTREGFNGECPYDHLAPSGIVGRSSQEETIGGMAAMLSLSGAFLRLRDQAWVIQSDAGDESADEETFGPPPGHWLSLGAAAVKLPPDKALLLMDYLRRERAEAFEAAAKAAL